MATFSPIGPEQAESPANEILAGLEQQLGMVPNIYAAMARSPSTLAALMSFGDELDKGSLSTPLKEKIALAVSNRNGCAYCVSAHTAIARNAGVSEQETVDAQRGRAEGAREEAILKLAVALNAEHGHGDNREVQAALDAGVSQAEIIEVVGQVVKNIMTNTFNGIAGTEIDFPKTALAD